MYIPIIGIFVKPWIMLVKEADTYFVIVCKKLFVEFSMIPSTSSGIFTFLMSK